MLRPAALILSAGLLARLWRMSQISLWSDEYHSIRVIRYPLSEIVAGRYVGDLNPPLYYLLLRLFTVPFGDGELALRSFSLIWGMAALALCGLIAWELSGSRRVSLAALALAACHPLLINYAVEVRSYALVTFLALLSIYAYLRARRARKAAWGWAALAGLGACASAYSHHFGGLIFGVLAAFLALDATDKQRRPAVLVTLLAMVGAVLAYLPGLLLLRRQFASYPPLPPDRVPLAAALQLFTFSYHHPPYEPLLGLLAGATAAAGLAMLIAGRPTRRLALALALALGGCVAALCAAYVIGINLVPRYLVHIAALAYILMAAALAPGEGRLRRGAQLLGAVCLGAYLAYGLDFSAGAANESRVAPYRVDWRPVAAAIARERRDGEPLVLMGWDATPVQYYLGATGISPFELERQLREKPGPSYLILESYYGRKLNRALSPTTLYESPAEGVRLLRLTPGG